MKREAKRWHKALRLNDPDARARLARITPETPVTPSLRQVQHALAREYGFAGWTALKQALEAQPATGAPTSRAEALPALLQAAGHGSADRVGSLLDRWPEIINERADLNGSGLRTALHFGVGHEPVVRLLLERGADPDIRDEGDNAMPLHFAAERGDLAVVRLLIEHGADPVGDGTGHELNVLGWATCFDSAYHAAVAEYLLAHGARHTIHTAVAMGVADEIRRLAARSPADVNRPMDPTNHRRRPLHLAVVKRRSDSLAVLLDLGADTEAEDQAGLTALDQAGLSGEHELARQLMDHGAKLRLPAAVALERVDDIHRQLREDPGCLRPGGRWGRLIIRAAERASGRVIEALIANGASVHARDDHRTAPDNTHGFTALHAAAWNGNVEAIRVLLRHGAHPADREDRYWGTPAGWADYGGRHEARDLILEGAIDIFDAIEHRPGRIGEIVARDPAALDRKFGEYVSGDPRSRPWVDPAWTPLEFARANQHDEAARILRDLRARAADSGADRTADLLQWACLDWRHGGSDRVARMEDAGRLLARQPGLKRANLYTAVVCGELDEVRRLLADRPEAATAIGGPRSWPPLLYLCSARLPGRQWAAHAAAVMRLLLDHGADPNAFYPGGNADIHYTALTCVLGRGEEQALMHPKAPELTRLLLEWGADPHDNQVLYNVFADNTSRHLLGEDILWLLELMYEYSLRRGQRARWDDPTWPMFEMRGAASLGDEARRHYGSRFMLEAAVDRDLLGLAEWMLRHGADPNTPAGNVWPSGWQRSLWEEATTRGLEDMAQLLMRYGAIATPATARPRNEDEGFVAVCFAMNLEAARGYVDRRPEYLSSPHALFRAVRRDRPEVVDLLLDLGVSPDVEDARQGRKRALHEAAAAGAVRSAELLIRRGAEVDFRERTYNSTPLGWASYFRIQPMVELLGRHSRDVWDLARNGLTERLREALREQPDRARATSQQYGTPLFWLPSDEAAALAIAALLLEHGADPSVRDAQGRTAADVAVRRGMDEVAVLLRA
jgi:ankyrin repeat protein